MVPQSILNNSPLHLFKIILCCCTGFCLVASSGGYSLVVVLGLLTGGFLCCTAWALGRAGFSSCSTRAQWLRFPGPQSTGSIVVTHGLSCSEACGIFPDQGLNPYLLHWQAGPLPLSHHSSRFLRDPVNNNHLHWYSTSQSTKEFVSV